MNCHYPQLALACLCGKKRTTSRRGWEWHPGRGVVCVCCVIHWRRRSAEPSSSPRLLNFNSLDSFGHFLSSQPVDGHKLWPECPVVNLWLQTFLPKDRHRPDCFKSTVQVCVCACVCDISRVCVGPPFYFYIFQLKVFKVIGVWACACICVWERDSCLPHTFVYVTLPTLSSR